MLRLIQECRSLRRCTFNLYRSLVWYFQALLCTFETTCIHANDTLIAHAPTKASIDDFLFWPIGLSREILAVGTVASVTAHVGVDAARVEVA